MTAVPQRVMRFYGNTDYAMQAIGFKEIHFLHSEKLNDPFDPNFEFVTDFNDNYATLIDWVDRFHKENSKIFVERFPQDNWNRFVDGIVQYFESIRNNTFLFSTCEVIERQHPKDNLYMWGHYGNGHRGVAIEFDTALLAQSVLNKLKMLTGQSPERNEVWTEIYYTSNLPKITSEAIFHYVMDTTANLDDISREDTELSRIVKLMVRSKSLEWKEEHEWRLMWLNDETQLKTQRLALLDGTITAVYLGCLVSERLRESVVFETKRSFPDAELFMSKKAKGDFSLIFEPLC